MPRPPYIRKRPHKGEIIAFRIFPITCCVREMHDIVSFSLIQSGRKHINILTLWYEHA